jgi:putative NADH-flavin reductase
VRLFILGATGRTGVELIDLGLARGHELTAFVRSPQKVTRQDARLRVVAGDLHDADELARALPGHDAVLSAIGPKPLPAIRGTTLLQDCAASTVAAMRRAAVTRLAVVSSALLFDVGGPLANLLRRILRHHVRDLQAMEAIVRASELDWTLARPPRLVHARDERYRAQAGALPPNVTLLGARLSWRATAAFMLDAIDGRFRREIVGISR